MRENIITNHGYHLILGCILLLAGFLYLFNLGQEGYSNQYYAAAVKSMLTNPSLLFYNSYDPAGFVTVDKPPVSLWVQTASAAIFGFSGWAVILPQAVAGILSVLLLSLILSHAYGKTTGLIGSFILAITPIFVAVSRTNNMDGLLICILLGAVLAAVLAWRKGSGWYLLLAAVLIGIGFNVKMIQAFIVLPACFGLYLLCQKIPLKTRCIHAAGALVVLLIISFSWAAVIDMTPATERPYIGSSQNNSVIELIFDYNGLNRIVGGFAKPGQFPGNSGDTRSPGGTGQFQQGMPPREGMPPGIPDEENRSARFQTPPGSPGGSGPRGMNDGGEPGIFRMGNAGMAGQISWLVPFALIGLLAFLRRKLPAILDEKAVILIAMLLWLIPELLYFSFTTGFYHTYYLVMVAAPLAGVVAIVAKTLVREYQSSDIRGWILPVAVGITGIVQWQFLRYDADFVGYLPEIILGGTLFLALLLAGLRVRIHLPSKARSAVIAISLALLCVSPAVWAATPVIYKGNGSMPIAGPELVSGHAGPGAFGGGGGPGGINGNSSRLYEYLTTHQNGEEYMLGVPSSMAASDLIIKYAAPVMAFGGFAGGDPILNTEKVQSLVAEGKIRYFLLPGGDRGMPGQENTTISTWVKENCTAVPDSEWTTGTDGTEMRNTLYDCNCSGGSQ